MTDIINTTASIKNFHKGLNAEIVVKTYMEVKGFELLFHRFKTKYGEIDLIFKKNNLIIFLEVKTRKNNYEVHFAITLKQQNRIIDTAKIFIAEYLEYQNYDFRFDAALVVKEEIIYYENIFI